MPQTRVTRRQTASVMQVSTPASLQRRRLPLSSPVRLNLLLTPQKSPPLIWELPVEQEANRRRSAEVIACLHYIAPLSEIAAAAALESAHSQAGWKENIFCVPQSRLLSLLTKTIWIESSSPAAGFSIPITRFSKCIPPLSSNSSL